MHPKVKLLGIDIYSGSPGRYFVKYAGETFHFASWQSIVAWVRHLREHEAKQGYERTDAGLEKREVKDD